MSVAYNLRKIANFISKKGEDIAIATQKMKKIGKKVKDVTEMMVKFDSFELKHLVLAKNYFVKCEL